LRDRVDEIRAAGAELVIVGNGAPFFAQAFREDFALDGPLLVDPELSAYRAAGLRRGRVEMLSPRLAGNAWRALRGGHRQEGVQGDPWQLGGVFVIRPGGDLCFRYASREAGDHPPVDHILDALAPEAPVLSEEPERSALAATLGRGLSFLVDPTIVFSFDRNGFRIHSLAFDPSDLDVDLAGRRAVVTGANSGIGFEAARALADLGAEVILLCRDAERGETAATRIREETGNARVRAEVCDVSSLESVRKLAAVLGDEPLHVLVHNAGGLPDERIETPEGLELCWATHVAGPHLLTKLLQPALERADDARVIWVSSGGMYTRRLNLDDPAWKKRKYDGVLAYAETKRAQVVLSELWAQRLRRHGISVSAMHPGWADTPGVQSSIPGFHRVTRAILRTPAEGADTVVWLAAAPGAAERSGRFFFDRVARRTHLIPGTEEPQKARRALWRRCERAASGAA
jgi:NAD(P)-dependent dehydrogenase (short-subunit alcohol dehydrogenase family)